MHPIRSRRDLAMLLEKQMAASARAGAPASPDEDLETRTALKTYLLEVHGRMRTEPFAALTELVAPLGMVVTPTDEPELLALALGDLHFWLDTTLGRFHRLYTVGAARDTDRVHEALVSGSGLVECVWLPPRSLESLARDDARMVLFSLRHDRRPLRRTPDELGVDSVTLRFWGPRALETLDKLRRSDVLPHATSVFSVRIRRGDEERYCLAEVFHSGKITAVGTSFAEHERIVRRVLDEHSDRAVVLEHGAREPRRVTLPVAWTVDDLGYAVGRIFGGAAPFRLWGIPEATGPESFRVRAVDTDVGRAAVFELDRQGVTLEFGPRTPASVVVRFLSNLQYHVNADLAADVLVAEPLLQLALPPAAPVLPFGERATLPEVARVVLAEAVALYVRGVTHLSTAALLEATHNGVATEALHDLSRRVLAEAAAYEWRTWLRPVVSPEGRSSWRFHDPLPMDATQRLRELVRLNRQAQQLVARLSGTAIARWLQLSLFGPEALVPPLVDELDA